MLQTFLPSPSYSDSAAVLDWKRLYRQIHEADLILKRMDSPAGLLWQGYDAALYAYRDVMLAEWLARGYATKLTPYNFPVEAWPEFPDVLHASHRANLLRKNYKFYGKLDWEQVPSDYYLWKDREGLWYWQRQGSTDKLQVRT